MGDSGAGRKGRPLIWRRARWALLALALLVPVARAAQLYLAGAGAPLRVGLVYDPAALPELQYVRNAYESVFREEGIPHAWVSARELSLLSGADAADRYPALVFADALNQRMPVELRDRVGEYLDAGGDVAVVFDAGVREPGGAFRPGGLLSEVLGVEYLRYRQDPDRAYVQGNVHFSSPEVASEWGVPPGKLYKGDVVGGYAYGSLDYPMANARAVAGDLDVIASDGGVPVLTLRDVGAGHALWVNLPLGYLKAYSDDMPLRAIMRSFLFRIAGVPHLVSSPGGVGGLVIDWHIDSAVEWQGIPSLIRGHLVRRDLVQQFDVTAGPDRDEEGDGLGFDACGAGRSFLERLLPFGEIGSHGGWAHNLFSDGLKDDTLAFDEVLGLVERNDDCLESVTGYPIRGYAAPNGVHPQPMMTDVLERAGIVGYYYTGDTGSPPNRTFFDGRMVSDRVWAFPVMPNGLVASIGEMVKADQRPHQIQRWLNDTLDAVVEGRSIRLMYSHPYDLLTRPDGRPLPARYRRAFARFLDRVEALQREGGLVVDSMGGFVDFLERFVRTSVTFVAEGDELAVTLDNAQGLSSVTVAVPASLVRSDSPTPAGVTETAGGGERLLTVEGNPTHLAFRLPLAAES